ncbi:hypothetical protein IFM89_008117 [Coptis chinensis]|uniref:RNA polymerase-associated protein LEO1 n=1 Tax=Coptis chinensis TaxID=261450 RepID=A0A835IVJ2_9MAGN|nr:hypothetical protein IFM89_008117 [Coptis chinensis]
MMQNLFGDQSEEEEEEEEEIESEHESNRQPDYASDEGEGEVDLDGDGEIDVEKQGDAEVESEAELHNLDPDPGESEGERPQSSPEREVNDQHAEVEEKEGESDEQEEFEQEVRRGRRWNVADSGSERSEENHSVDNEDEEVDQARKSSPLHSTLIASPHRILFLKHEFHFNTRGRSPSEEKDQAHISHSAAEIRDVFGDSDEEEQEEYATRNDLEQDSHRSPMEEEEGYEKNSRPEDMVPDDNVQYESEDNIEHKPKEKPVGPPLELEIPLRTPPGRPEKMNMIKVSNIMGIDPKPFDPKTYVEEDMFVTDESGSRKRIRLENNIVRWRSTRKPDGTKSYESNARFVRWSDGSLQLLIGNEVLDISVQQAQHDQAHLFLRHGKGILQSQGRLQRKMRFMPSSLSSNSHRLLTALVDSRHKKVYKVKNHVTDNDPEREKEEKERALGQTIKANEILNRKRERVSRKYSHNVDRGRQLSPGFLEDALDEDDEPDYHEPRRSVARRRFEEDLEVEAHAEKRIINAKRSQVHKDIPRRSSVPAVRPSRRGDYSESEREESEYETDGDEVERTPPRKRVEEPEYEDEESDELNGEQAGRENEDSDEEEEPGQRGKDIGSRNKRKEIESDGDSPRRKPIPHRRMVVYDSDED